MCDDQRSKRIVAVIHCVVNHNARLPGCARYPGMNYEVVDILKKHDVGVLQMPCPEMVCLGLARTTGADVSLRDALDTPEGRSRCLELAVPVVDAIEEYRRNDYIVAAVLGGDIKSPGCAVPAPPTEDGEDTPVTPWGVFTEALVEELRRRRIRIPVRGIRDSARETMLEDMEWLDSALAES